MQQHSHPAIIPREEWDAVQTEFSRREEFRKRHGIRSTGSSTDDPLYSRVFCTACGGKFIRKFWKGCNGALWKCENAEKKKGHTCQATFVRESILKAAVVAAWNELVEKRDEMLPRWESMVAEGDALKRYRAKQMIAVTAEGPLDGEVPELTRMFLDEIVIHSPDEMTVAFLDGSRVKVCFQTGTAEVA